MSSEVFEELRRLIDSDDAHFVGGCVRDGWLGRPIADVDVVVAGDPAPAARRLARQTGGSPFALSEAHGAWRVVLPDRTVDITARRGRIEQIDERTGMRVIRVLVPLAELFGYATDLRSRTQGRASHTPMQLHAYQEVPAQISKEIVARVRGE